MAREQQRARVHGPYQHRNRWRVVVVREGGKRSVGSYETREKALEVIRDALRELAGETTVGEAIDEYEVWYRGTGAQQVTVQTSRERLDRFFDGEFATPIRRLTPKRAAAIYADLREAYAVQTHRHTLQEAKRLGEWCVERGLMRVNPVADVKPIGRPRRGKPQLRVTEARLLLDASLGAFRHGDAHALAPAICLGLGLRAAEVARLQARDVDDGGRLLWVEEAKTEAGRRVVEVDGRLRVVLAAQAANRIGQLIPGATRHTVHHHCDRLCRAAGVPEVGPHGLRATHMTLARQHGATSRNVMDAVGHASPTVQERHYLEPGTVERLRVQAAWGTLTTVRVPQDDPSEKESGK